MQDFERAENWLLENMPMTLDVGVVNPVKVCPYDKNKTWADYMREDIKALTGCNATFMLKGWRRSKGARLERYIAKKLGLKVWYEAR